MRDIRLDADSPECFGPFKELGLVFRFGVRVGIGKDQERPVQVQKFTDNVFKWKAFPAGRQDLGEVGTVQEVLRKGKRFLVDFRKYKFISSGMYLNLQCRENTDENVHQDGAAKERGYHIQDRDD